jgi:hypothetical protein
MFGAHSSHTTQSVGMICTNRRPALSFEQSVATYLRSECALVELFTLLLTASLLNGLCYIGLRLLRNESKNMRHGSCRALHSHSVARATLVCSTP